LAAPVDVAALVCGVFFAMAVERWRRRRHVLKDFSVGRIGGEGWWRPAPDQ
jgi:hypothetical protein